MALLFLAEDLNKGPVPESFSSHFNITACVLEACVDATTVLATISRSIHSSSISDVRKKVLYQDGVGSLLAMTRSLTDNLYHQDPTRRSWEYLQSKVCVLGAYLLSQALTGSFKPWRGGTARKTCLSISCLPEHGNADIEIINSSPKSSSQRQEKPRSSASQTTSGSGNGYVSCRLFFSYYWSYGINETYPVGLFAHDMSYCISRTSVGTLTDYT